MSGSGYILTNAHLVQPYIQITPAPTTTTTTTSPAATTTTISPATATTQPRLKQSIWVRYDDEPADPLHPPRAQCC